MPGPTRSRRAVAVVTAASLVLFVPAAVRAQDSAQVLRPGDRVRLTSPELRQVRHGPMTYLMYWPVLVLSPPLERRIAGTLRASGSGDSVTMRTFGSVFTLATPTGATVSRRSVTQWEVSRGRRRVAGAAVGMLYGAVLGATSWGMCGIGGGDCPAALTIGGFTAAGAALGAYRAPDRWQRVPAPAANPRR
jgi:hypothetical protein